MLTGEAMLHAYAAGQMVAAANGIRGLYAIERDDPNVGAVQLECDADGNVQVTLLDRSANPIGGYML